MLLPNRPPDAWIGTRTVAACQSAVVSRTSSPRGCRGAALLPAGSVVCRRMARRWSVGTLLAALAVVALFAGCASWKRPVPDLPDVRGERARRADDAVREFEARRERAEIEAALTAVRAGDAETARARLEQVLARNPQQTEARRLLAELHLLAANAQAAEEILKPLLPAAAGDAAISHTWGLVLDAQGKTDEARAALRRAVELEPDHPVYRASLQSAMLEPVPEQQPGPPGKASSNHASPNQAGTDQAGTDQAGTDQAGTDQAGTDQAGTDQAGTDQAGTDQAGTDQAAVDLVGFELAGYHQASAHQPGLDQSDSYPTPASRQVWASIPPGARQCLARAEVQFQAGRPEAAATALRQAALHDPSNRQIAIAAAVMAIRYNHPRLAVERIEALPPGLANSVALQQALGIAWYRLGDCAQAEAAFRRTIALDNTRPLSYFLLGCTLKRRGAANEADAALAQAARLDVHFAMAQSPPCAHSHEPATRNSDRGLCPGRCSGSSPPLSALLPPPPTRSRAAHRP